MNDMRWRLVNLDPLARLGWVDAPTPLTPLPDLAERLGVDALTIKRDDLSPPLCGGTKPRKLDYLLATTPLAQAAAWHSMGAIGSGHLAALTAAAHRLGRRLFAHCFWEPISGNVVENLAFVASGPTVLRYHASRSSLLVNHPRLLLAKEVEGFPVIPPGATTPAGMVGLVRAGLELAEQIEAGVLAQPDRIYVALGSGGTVVGLSVGLALGGVRTTIHAVAVVERPLATAGRLNALTRQLRGYLETRGLGWPAGLRPVPVLIDRKHLGRGYGLPTTDSRAACEILSAHGIALEPVYTGKAMAALVADGRRRQIGPVLFWHTAHRPGLDASPEWRSRLPAALDRRLGRAEPRC